MTEDVKPDEAGQETAVSRREFGAVSLAAGLAAVAGVPAAAAAERPLAFLDAQREVDKTKKIGTQGYCMGGPLVVKTAAAVPDRIGAGASFHGGGLVTDNPNSPHLLAPKIKARMYFGIAANDDMRQPDAKDTLKAAFAASNVPTEIEVYGSLHGWCVFDFRFLLLNETLL